jgi:hypothetical protein
LGPARAQAGLWAEGERAKRSLGPRQAFGQAGFGQAKHFINDFVKIDYLYSNLFDNLFREKKSTK